MAVLVTGAAGFIGYHVSRALLERGETVLGVDNLNTYYDPKVKEGRLAQLAPFDGFSFARIDLADHNALDRATSAVELDRIVHLAAQPGVRYSVDHPRAYGASNLVGHLNILELARHRQMRHLVYASSSSVYGANRKLPFSVEDRVDQPISLYAATKKAAELMSESYAHLYRIPQTGLRFFTVYGPWGRPDMAVWTFTRQILAGEPIQVYNHGRMRRDFTYVGDVVQAILTCLGKPPADDGLGKSGGSRSPHAIYNIGNNRSVELEYFIDLIEQACGRTAIRQPAPIQPGDVVDTYADIEASAADFGFKPETPIERGLPLFVDWYKGYSAGN